MEYLIDKGSVDAKDIIPATSGQLLAVGSGVLLELLHTPGHTPGSLSICIRERSSDGEGSPAEALASTAWSTEGAALHGWWTIVFMKTG